MTKKRSVHGVWRYAPPHFFVIFNAGLASAVVFQQAVKPPEQVMYGGFAAKIFQQTVNPVFLDIVSDHSEF